MKTQTKIVMRRLPRSLTKEQFLEQIHPFNKFNYLRFCNADKTHKEFSNTRAYIDFVSEDDMYKFKNQFESKLFIDDDGNESYGLIEFSVFQKIPGKNKLDTKQNSLSHDSDFLKFTQEINDSPKNANIGSVESNLEEIKNKEVEKLHMSTPLLDYINMSKKDRGRKDDYRKKSEFSKPFIKKDIENIVEQKSANKTEVKAAKKNNPTDTSSDVFNKSDKVIDKMEIKKAKPIRNDIKTYAANYEEYSNEYDGYTEERNTKRGFENRNYRDGRYDYESKGYGGSYYYGARKGEYGEYGRPEGGYRGHQDYYGYGDYSQSQSQFSRPQPTKNKRAGGSKRPPSYSASRKD